MPDRDMIREVGESRHWVNACAENEMPGDPFRESRSEKMVVSSETFAEGREDGGRMGCSEVTQ